MPTPRCPLLVASLALLLIVAACGAAATPSPGPTPAASPSPDVSPSPAPSPSPSGAPTVDNEAEAAARVLSSNPRFIGIGPALPDIIGQSAWYEVTAGMDGYDVTVIIGWGDCPAGCISSHRWTHHVMGDGTVTLVSEEGDDLPDDLPPPPDVTGTGSLDIAVVAGPTCPVETNPPDPECDPRAVENATIVVRDADGVEVARAMTDADGRARFTDLPAGIYIVEGEPVEGLMGDAPPAAAWVIGPDPGTATLSYDTGIR